MSRLIRRMTADDVELIHIGLSGHDVSKPREYIERCWQENETGDRVTFLALHDADFVGWGHVVLRPEYPYFADNKIPEIQNFDVIPPFRKQGVGTQLIDVIEKFVYHTYDAIGIGFGLHAGYGTAQRMYVKRGYVPDGRGVIFNNSPVTPGAQVPVDELALFLTKDRPK